jgi:glycosyltransferase involved in cell wall biosynthesis
MAERPIRVLKINGSLGAFNVGGIERWLVEVVRRVDRSQIAIDFFVHTRRPGRFDEVARAHGAPIYRGCRPTRPRTHARRLLEVLGRPPGYDVVHTHVDPLGFPLWLARRAGVPVTVAHSHNNAPEMQQWRWGARHALRPVSRYLVQRYATHGLAASHEAAEARLGGLLAAGRCRVLHCGIPLQDFSRPIDRAALRRALGLAPDAFVVGHVGRFVEQKNHRLIIEIFEALLARQPRARLLLVGDGPLRPSIARYARQRGVAGQTIFTGLRDDVPQLLRGAMDAFLLPSRHEGLALVLLEAQAAGLPSLVSDRVPAEGVVVDELVQRLPLARPAAQWADALLSLCASPLRPTPDQALRAIKASDFAIERAVANLTAFYRECVGAC